MLLRIFSRLYRREFGYVWRSVSQHASQRLDIAGIYPPIATPFTQKGNVDYQSLDKNLQKYGSMPFRGKHNNFTSNEICLFSRAYLDILEMLFSLSVK